MSLFSLLGALEIGLIFSLVALGVFISFRLLRFPDLTVDGSFPLGGAVCATLIAAGTDPFLATIAATFAGARRRPGDGLAERQAQDHGPAGEHPDDDRAVLGQPAHHGQAQRAADHRAHHVLHPAAGLAAGLRGPSAHPGGGRDPGQAAAGLVLRHADRPGDARHRLQRPHGPRAGRQHRPHDPGRHGAVERAGGDGRRAVRADPGRLGHLDGHRHYRDRPGRGDRGRASCRRASWSWPRWP